jgi:hypothetical protein
MAERARRIGIVVFRWKQIAKWPKSARVLAVGAVEPRVLESRGRDLLHDTAPVVLHVLHDAAEWIEDVRDRSIRIVLERPHPAIRLGKGRSRPLVFRFDTPQSIIAMGLDASTGSGVIAPMEAVTAPIGALHHASRVVVAEAGDCAERIDPLGQAAIEVAVARDGERGLAADAAHDLLDVAVFVVHEVRVDDDAHR